MQCHHHYTQKEQNFPIVLHDQVLDRVESATYLGVEVSSNLTWSKHITKTAMKANHKLAFVKRNIPIRNQDLKQTAYKGLVRPVLEYCAPVWDPHQAKYINLLEMVQRRAARFVLARYERKSSVTKMLRQLQWETLAHRRIAARLSMFYQIQHAIVAIPLPDIVTRPKRPRPGHLTSFKFHTVLPMHTDIATFQEPSEIGMRCPLPSPVRAVFLFSGLLYHPTPSNFPSSIPLLTT